LLRADGSCARLRFRAAIKSITTLERLTNQLVNKAESDVVSGIDESEDAYRASRTIVSAFAVGAIGLALLLGRTISWSLIGPIGEIGARLRHIAAGEFAQRVSVANRDELGELATNINRTSDQLGQLYTDLNAEKERSEALLLNTLPRRTLALVLAPCTALCDAGAGRRLVHAIYRQPSVPGNGGTDMVWSSPLTGIGDFRLGLAGCQRKNLIAQVRRAALATRRSH
jgi:HAMP domain-containing protein